MSTFPKEGFAIIAKEILYSQSPKQMDITHKMTSQCATIANAILDILEQYGKHFRTTADQGHLGWIGRTKFFDMIHEKVVKNEPIKMILPAFPWKSINTTEKVIGRLPDLGEVLALARLNAICRDIQSVYAAGAEMIIATDGLVFDDIVGIPDEDTWAYSEALMEIVAQRGFSSIKMLRVMDILALPQDKILTKELYMSLVGQSRTTLLRSYGRTEEDVRNMIKKDGDTLNTYCGFIRFLETDLRHSPVAKIALSGTQYRKYVKKIAMGMMIRAESFTKLLQDRCPDFVRLSIHPSSGAMKLSVPLILQTNGEFPRTPWHCTIAVGIDGSYRTIHAKDARKSHNLIRLEGVPYYYREKSSLWDWEDDVAVFEPQYPSGMLVRPVAISDDLSALEERYISRLRELANVFHGPIEVVGFTNFRS